MKCRAAVLSILAAAGAACAQVQGPSTLQTPYMRPSVPATGTQTYSVVSNGNGTTTPNETHPRLGGGTPYRLVGAPDGIGLMRTTDDVANGTLTLTCNHELSATAGIVRGHGNRGSFISQWKIRTAPGPSFLSVVGGQDLIQNVKLYNPVLNQWETYNAAGGGMPLYSSGTNWNASGVPLANANKDGFARFCSADVPPVSALKFGALGTDARMHLTGEESGTVGRAFAHILTGPEAGTSYQLPTFGKYAWENVLACPYPQAKTIVIGTDDQTPGNVYVHIGTKLGAGNDVERAGLLNAQTYGIVIAGVTVTGSQPVEHNTWVLGTAASGVVYSKPFTLYNLGDCTHVTGPQMQTLGDSHGVMNWLRPEDGAWDPANPSRFYFATTDNIAGNSRLWLLKFTDITQPELGGTVSMLGDGSFPATWSGGFSSVSGADARMMDNVTVSRSGQVVVQEDSGNNTRLVRMWQYTPWTDALAEVCISDSTRFITGAPNFLTQNEENSGIVTAEEFLGSGWFFFTIMAHYTISGELAEGGQILAAFLPGTQVGAACYANCDQSGTAPVLNANDFQCFLNSFAAGGSYANCDGSSVEPILNANDFQCFLNSFANGCG